MYMYIYVYIYMCVYIYICVCVRVCKCVVQSWSTAVDIQHDIVHDLRISRRNPRKRLLELQSLQS